MNPGMQPQMAVNILLTTERASSARPLVFPAAARKDGGRLRIGPALLAQRGMRGFDFRACGGRRGVWTRGIRLNRGFSLQLGREGRLSGGNSASLYVQRGPASQHDSQQDHGPFCHRGDGGRGLRAKDGNEIGV